MSSSTKHRAANTHSGCSRNDESTRLKQKSDAEHGMQSQGRKAEGGKKAPAANAGKHG